MAAEMLRYSELTDNEVNFYDKYGYLSLPGLLSRESAKSLAEEVLEIMAGLGINREALRNASSSKDKLRQSRQYLAGSGLARLVHSEALQAIAARLMGGPSTVYLPFTAVKSGGGGGRFHFHQDNQYTRFAGPGINIWFALMEMSPQQWLLADRAGDTPGWHAGFGRKRRPRWTSHGRCRARVFSAAAHDAGRCRGFHAADIAWLWRKQHRPAAPGLCCAIPPR